MLKLIISLSLLGLLWSCASKPPSENSPKTSTTLENGDLDHFHLAEDAKAEAKASNAPEQQVEELEIIPTELNANVEKWIAYFQGRGRPHMEKYLLRSTRYEALMKKVLRDNKLPEDLFYVALIESGFSSEAFSHASAVGFWQFVRGTGKRYKLTINKMVDSRRDPVLSTQAAAEYFKDLYKEFNSWYLSMAAYNVGEGRVQPLWQPSIRLIKPAISGNWQKDVMPFRLKLTIMYRNLLRQS